MTAAFPGSPLFLLLEGSQLLKGAASLLNCLQMHPMNLASNGFHPANRLNLTTGQTLSSIILSLLVTIIVLNVSQSHLLIAYMLFLNVTCFIITTCVMCVPIYCNINNMKVLNSVQGTHTAQIYNRLECCSSSKRSYPILMNELLHNAGSAVADLLSFNWLFYTKLGFWVRPECRS